MGLFTFQVDDKGQIVNESGEGYTVEDGKLTIVANDTPIEAKIVKTDKDGNSLNYPIGDFDHALDAVRYALWTKYAERPGYGIYNIAFNR